MTKNDPDPAFNSDPEIPQNTPQPTTQDILPVEYSSETPVQSPKDIFPEEKAIPQIIAQEEPDQKPFIDCRILSRELEIPRIYSAVEKKASLLWWDAMTKANAYRVYKKDASGNMVFLAEVTTPRYEILFSSPELAFEDFGVKAILKNENCDIDTTGYAMTSIQTGASDTMHIFIALVSTLLIGGISVVYRKKYVSGQ